MRTKNRGGKRRKFNSLPSSNPSLISGIPLYKDEANEANEEYDVDGSIRGASEYSGTCQDNNGINDNDDAGSNNDNSDDGESNSNNSDDAEAAIAATKEEVNNDDADSNDDESDDADGNDDESDDADSNNDDSDDAEAAAAATEEECNSKGFSNHGVGDDHGVVVPNSLEEVDRHAAEPSEHCIALDWLEREFCIKCNSGKGQVLVCSENGCPVAIHEVCMKSKPRLDDVGKFYCPYCWYKRELARAKELRREAMFAKTKLSNFICLNRGVGNEKQEDETTNMKAASVSVMARKIDTGDCENGPNDDDNEIIHHNLDVTAGTEAISEENSDEKRNTTAERLEKFEGSKRIQEEDIEDSSDSVDEFGRDQWKIQPTGSSHLEIVTTKETSGSVGVFEENLGEWGKKEPLLPNSVGTSMAPRTSGATLQARAIESFDFVAPDLDTERQQVCQKRVKRPAQRTWLKKADTPKMPSSQTYNCPENKKVNQKGKATAAENSLQCQEYSKRFMISTVYPQKRRRLFWKPEEEDILKEGVRRYSTKMNKNIPWRKILDFGHHIFDSTRTPADLKDKWKNIMAKEFPNTNSNKGVLPTSVQLR